MTDRATNIVNVNYTRADGYLLEIDGIVANPFVFTSDAVTHTKACAEDAVREALGIPEGVPVSLRITTDDDWLRNESKHDMEPADD
ncbi:hypothetical protein [Kitasatospora griseola]|uniref:hypothetical protein n=1 Tax=Kitasatospora griseola TaxID=2064 RepID=UPI003824EF48